LGARRRSIRRLRFLIALIISGFTRNAFVRVKVLDFGYPLLYHQIKAFSSVFSKNIAVFLYCYAWIGPSALSHLQIRIAW
jgi:hypothetical protein